jgi:hypothetical protein
MSSLFITEFDNLVITDNSVPPFGKFNGNTHYQAVTIGSTSTPSSAFQPTTKFVRVTADASCAMAYTPPGASTVSATATDAYVAANAHGEYFGVDAGGLISVITAS